MAVNPKYKQFGRKAQTAIAVWGEPTILIKPPKVGTPTMVFDPATGQYVPADPLDSPAAATEHPCRAVVMPVNQMRVDNTNVLASDMTAKLAALGLSVVPAIGDKIVRGSDAYAVLGIRKIGPDGAEIIYDLDLRLN